MQFVFGKQACQNIRRSLRQEWIETNGLGDYASSTLVGCNTRKYHGLLVVDNSMPAGRYVLLSTLEESLLLGGKECSFSCRRHPGGYYPSGYEYQQKAEICPWITQRYRYGDIRFSRCMMLMPGKHMLIVRYRMVAEQPLPKSAQPKLRIKPLLAFRNIHSLTQENMDLQVKTWPAESGFFVHPYPNLPQLYTQVSCPFIFHPSPDWYKKVEYMVEEERGFPCQEDLFQPGVIDIPLTPGKEVLLAFSTEAIEEPTISIAAMWNAESARRMAAEARFSSAVPTADRPGVLECHLSGESRRFTVHDVAGAASVIAGYHWFGAWGRDTCISIPGLTFFAGRQQEGLSILLRLSKSVRNGLIPNVFSADGNHAYNCVDSSLWFIWAVQKMDKAMPKAELLLREQIWPVIKDIINAYRSGVVPHVTLDDAGFLNVGDENTQLTWMDASVNGKPVTPRFGCPVEIEALWYNALAYARVLSRRFDSDPAWDCVDILNSMRAEFKRRFWIEEKKYLADVWRKEGRDESLRPNQLFAISMPYSILDEEYHYPVVKCVQKTLLTPFGVRTLWPGDPAYHSLYVGDSVERDSAYHQGTVWPWLLGAYTEALIKAAWNMEKAISDYLEYLTPMFTQHLPEAGIGSISEIFDADPPHMPNGCIAQAWSVAEVNRSLCLLRKAAPKIFAEWEKGVISTLHPADNPKPTIADGTRRYGTVEAFVRPRGRDDDESQKGQL